MASPSMSSVTQLMAMGFDKKAAEVALFRYVSCDDAVLLVAAPCTNLFHHAKPLDLLGNS